MKFSVGQEVKMMDEPGTGIIKAIRSNAMLVVELDGFDFECAATQVIAVGDNNEVEVAVPERVDGSFKDSSGNSLMEQLTNIQWSGKNHKGVPEFDLHLHELLHAKKFKNDHAKKQYQLAQFKLALRKAVLMQLSKIVFIHGVGSGKLKAELTAFLDQYDCFEYYDASMKHYGVGATEVRIFKNKVKGFQ